MIYGQPQYSDDQLGFSITSLAKKVGSTAVKTVTVPTKYAVKATTTTARYAGKGVKVAAKAAYKPIEWTLIKPTVWLTSKLMTPVKSRVQKIVQRRAAKIAFDRRKATTPTPAEVSEARAWTRNKLKGELPHGPVLALFADGASYDYAFGDYQLGAPQAVVAAAVPVLVALATTLISRYANSGEAPANPGADQRAAQMAPDAPVDPGQVDMTPVQDAADQAHEAIDQAQEAATGKRSGRSMTLPGGMKVQRSHLMLGGAVVLGLILVMSMSGGKKS